MSGMVVPILDVGAASTGAASLVTGRRQRTSTYHSMTFPTIYKEVADVDMELYD